MKNKAKASGISYRQCLQLFFQEAFLRRLAGSKHAENFVLKGGLFIYTLTNFESRECLNACFLFLGEHILAYGAKGTLEILRDVFPGRTGSDTALGVAQLLVIFPAANVAYMLHNRFPLIF